MRVRGYAPVSAIEAESWALPVQPVPVSPDAPAPAPPPSEPAPAARIAEPPTPPIELASEPAPPASAAPAAPASPEPSTADADPAPTTPTLEPLSMARELSHWESALQQVTDRERLIEVAFSIAACFAPRVALFTVNQGSVQGLRQLERGATRPLEGVLVPLAAPCMLAEAATKAEPLRVEPAGREADRRVLELLQDGDATEVALYPVAIKKRVVNVLYASNGKEPLGPIAHGALSLLAQEMGLAYGRLILMRKAGAGPS